MGVNGREQSPDSEYDVIVIVVAADAMLSGGKKTGGQPSVIPETTASIEPEGVRLNDSDSLLADADADASSPPRKRHLAAMKSDRMVFTLSGSAGTLCTSRFRCPSSGRRSFADKETNGLGGVIRSGVPCRIGQVGGNPE